MRCDRERVWPADDPAWVDAADERFSVCLHCRTTPLRHLRADGYAPSLDHFVDFFCSSRCEAAFFGPAADWSAVYRAEIERNGVRQTRPRDSDGPGPEGWRESDFVRRRGYLDLPTGRSYAPEREWPDAGLPPLEELGQRPHRALGGRVGYLAAVAPPSRVPPAPALSGDLPRVDRRAPTPHRLTHAEGTSP